MRRAAAAVAAALTLAIAAGCGGESAPADKAPAVTSNEGQRFADVIAEHGTADQVDLARAAEGIVVYRYDGGLTITFKDGKVTTEPLAPAAGSPEVTEEEPRGPGDITTGEQ